MVDKAKNVKQEAKTVSKNFAEFVETSSLAGYQGLQSIADYKRLSCLQSVRSCWSTNCTTSNTTISKTF